MYLTIHVVDYCQPAIVVVVAFAFAGDVAVVAAEPFAIGSALVADPFPRSLDTR